MKIILLGYMASGKSTISKSLGNTLGIEALDLDDYIVEKENNSIKNIFESKGEIYFRKQESFYLSELISSNKNFVLALGGGTPCYSNNIELIKSQPNSFYLKANINTLFERLRNEKENRPLVSELSDEKLKEFIAKHLFERSPYYNQATHKIIIDQKSVENILDEIQSLTRNMQ